LSVIDGLERPDCRPAVIGDLRGMDLMATSHPFAIEDVEDGIPPFGEFLVAGVDDLCADRREQRHTGTDLRTGETDDGVHAEPTGDSGGPLHVLGGPLPHALGLTVAPHVVADDRAVPEVDRVVADGLTG